MPDRLKGKVAIVVGAGSVGPGWGNGKATAVSFAREGASVLCVDINPAAAEGTRGVMVHSMRIRDVYPDEARRLARLIRSPLQDAIALAVEEGTIPSRDVEADTWFIHRLAMTSLEQYVTS